MPEFTYYTKFGKQYTKTVVASPEAEQVLAFDAKSSGTPSLTKTISVLEKQIKKLRRQIDQTRKRIKKLRMKKQQQCSHTWEYYTYGGDWIHFCRRCPKCDVRQMDFDKKCVKTTFAE